MRRVWWLLAAAPVMVGGALLYTHWPHGPRFQTPDAAENLAYIVPVSADRAWLFWDTESPGTRAELIDLQQGTLGSVALPGEVCSHQTFLGAFTLESVHSRTVVAVEYIPTQDPSSVGTIALDIDSPGIRWTGTPLPTNPGDHPMAANDHELLTAVPSPPRGAHLVNRELSSGAVHWDVKVPSTSSSDPTDGTVLLGSTTAVVAWPLATATCVRLQDGKVLARYPCEIPGITHGDLWYFSPDGKRVCRVDLKHPKTHRCVDMPGLIQLTLSEDKLLALCQTLDNHVSLTALSPDLATRLWSIPLGQFDNTYLETAADQPLSDYAWLTLGDDERGVRTMLDIDLINHRPLAGFGLPGTPGEWEILPSDRTALLVHEVDRATEVAQLDNTTGQPVRAMRVPVRWASYQFSTDAICAGRLWLHDSKSWAVLNVTTLEAVAGGPVEDMTNEFTAALHTAELQP